MLFILVCLVSIFMFVRGMNKANMKRRIDPYRVVKIERSRKEFRAMARKYP